MAVARIKGTQKPVQKPLPWKRFGVLPKELAGKRIFIGSLQNPVLLAFMRFWSGRISVEYLTADNMADAFSGREDTLLVYGEDIYPDIAHKCEVQELFSQLQRGHERSWQKQCFVSHDWAELSLQELDNVPALLCKLDEGFQSVHLSDANGNYRGTITCAALRKHFPLSIPAVANLGIPYSDNQAKDQQNIMKKTIDTERQEVPMLKEGRIVANGVKTYGAMGMDKHIYLKRFTPHWELISDEVIRGFLAGRKRIMLSSLSGLWLDGLRKRFASLADIVIYNGSNLNAYLNGDVDMLIYGSNVWPVAQARRYDVRLLYRDLLAEEIRRYLHTHGIAYYDCDVIAKADEWQQRIADPHKAQKYISVQSSWQGLREDYHAAVDSHDMEKKQIICGRRLDADTLEHYERTIFVFGPCIAMGAHADYGETIEALLQEKLVADGKLWRVVNCGMPGGEATFLDINALHFMLDCHMRQGDIVIQMSRGLWRGDSAFPLENFYNTHNAFDDQYHRQKSFWFDGDMAHMDKEGYAVWADFLFKKVREEPLPSCREMVKPMSFRLGEGRIRNPDLRKYLQFLAIHRRDGRNGAIVMNANPFTLGHAYLVEQARKQCDFLYIFVVEEDSSEISFAHRFAMVQANCSDLPNVDVLPSGKYMISQLTFTEYFTKEARQEERIFPSQDVRLFGDAIAPTLGIAKRFVGEEPLDKVTKQYNEAMKLILPEFGIELIEIPRREYEGQPINATEVRRWLKAGDWEKCSCYLPNAALVYLKEKMTGYTRNSK